MEKRLVAGCMTGTSMDGLDLALVSIEGSGLGLKVSLEASEHVPLGELAKGLRRLASQKPMSARRIAQLSLDLGNLHADALIELLGDRTLDLIAVHGQTVFHAPPLSWQLINPSVIAHRLDTPVVYDLRAADLAAGGQGAPITPLADFLLFRNPAETTAIVNLGGFVNMTVVPPSVSVDRVTGGDVCACNQLLDEIARTLFKRPYDNDGELAASGMVKAREYDELSLILGAQAEAGLSLGTGDELAAWIKSKKRRLDRNDLARTACAAIGRVVAERTRNSDRVLLAGGGTFNQTLVSEIEGKCRGVVQRTDDVGIPGEAREAIAMAILGALCQDREPITLPGITGLEGEPPVSGCWVIP